MTQAQVQANGSGIGFCGALTIAFIVLKLTGVIGWSYWWVLAPLWIPLAFVGAVFIGIALATVLFEYHRDSKRRKRAAKLREQRLPRKPPRS